MGGQAQAKDRTFAPCRESRISFPVRSPGKPMCRKVFSGGVTGEVDDLTFAPCLEAFSAEEPRGSR